MSMQKKSVEYISKQLQKVFFFSFLLIIMVFLSGCSQNGTSNKLDEDLFLDHMISFSEGGYHIPNISWGLSQQELIEDLELADDDIKIIEEREIIEVKNKREVDSLAAIVSVLYIFEKDYLVGADFLIHSQTDEELNNVCAVLADQAKELLPDPDGSTLSDLRKCGADVLWFGDDGSMFSIRFPQTQDDDPDVILISVRAPRS